MKVPSCSDHRYRVLVVGPLPPPYAGPELSMKAFLESPLKDKYDLHHLSTNVRSSNAEKGRLGIRLIVAFASFVTRLLVSLVWIRPHIVYTYVTATRMGWIGRDVWCIALSRLFRAKVVVHMRAGHLVHRLKKATRFEKAIIAWAGRRVSFGLVQSPSLASQFEGIVPPDRIAVVPNMIDTKRYAEVKPSSDGRLRLLFLGHLTTAKGYCEILRVMPHVAGIHPSVLFQFAGTKKKKERNVLHNQQTGALLPDHDPEEVFERLINGRFEKNYAYLGVLSEPEKITAIQECDVFVLPSFSEGFSMAILEAMSIGRPVVCTSVGAMQDFFQTGRNGEMIPPGDTKALQDAILRLLDDAAYRRQCGEENARYVRECFSQPAVAKEYERVFDRAVDGGCHSGHDNRRGVSAKAGELNATR